VASGSKETLSTSGRGPTIRTRLLSNEEVRGTRSNRRIVWVTKDQTNLPLDVQVFCNDDDLDTTDLFTVCYFEGQWHSIQWSKTKQRFRLGLVYPEIEQWNTDESDSEQESETKTQSDEDDPSDNTDRLIRAAPVPLAITSPSRSFQMSTTVTTTATHAATASSSQPVPAAPPAPPTAADVQNIFNNALRRQPGGGGPPRGGAPGGGPPGGGPAPLGAVPNAALQPVAVAADAKMMGQPPPIFLGDRTKADDFVDQVQGYLRLNHDVTGFNSPIKKIAFMLSHIQGSETNAWKRDMGNMLDGLNPAVDNIPLLWEQFLQEFRIQFQDTQRGNRARAQIESHRMKFPDIDQYISSFEELARTAGYTQGNEATTHYFIKGLSPSVMIDTMKPPMPLTYADIKQRAIDSTRSRMLIDDILGKRGPGQGRGRGQAPRFGSFGRGQQPYRPFFQQQRQPQGPPPQQQYNSTNAPRWMNNTPVPMDLSRTKAPTWRGRGGNAFGRAAPQNRPPLICFQCGKEGHFARNCPQRCFATNYAEYDAGASTSTMEPYEPRDPIASLKAQLDALTVDEKEKLAAEVGGDEDFSSA